MATKLPCRLVFVASSFVKNNHFDFYAFLRLWVWSMKLRGRPRRRPKKTWKEVVREDCQARKLNKEDALDRCKWRKVIKEAR